MATPEQKRRAMDAVAHRETRAHVRAFRGKSAVAPAAVASPISVGPTAGTPPPKSTDEYVAFDAKDKVERLKIRRANDPTRSPSYAYLLDVVYDGPYGTNFVLVFTFLMVMVRGKNLQNVVKALEMGTAEFIQEFDPDQWQKPKDEAAPFIESIEVVVQESGPSIADSESTDKTVH